MPELQSIANARTDTDLVTIVVSGPPAQAAHIARERNITAPVLIDDGTLRRRFGVERTPTTFVLGRDGRAVSMLVGEQTRDSIERALQRAM